tara:strand:+ start:382 stop:630 length:249 start_codon:yes stop_codon:yes gene_type:complete
MGVGKKNNIPIKNLWEAIVAKDTTRRYNNGNPLYDYWVENQKKLIGWSFNEFHTYVNSKNRTEVEIEFKKQHRNYGDFTQWI